MNENSAYKQAAEILKPIESDIPAHKGQSVSDKLVAALMSAYIGGKQLKEEEYCGSGQAQIVVGHMAVSMDAALDLKAIDRRYVAEKMRDMADILEKRKNDK
jgi:hypothetical protein